MASEDGRPTDTSFTGLLSTYDYQSPQRGQILQGVVLKVHDEAMIVDVGVKRHAFVPRKDLDGWTLLRWSGLNPALK